MKAGEAQALVTSELRGGRAIKETAINDADHIAPAAPPIDNLINEHISPSITFNMSVKSRVAAVTGANKGIGLAIGTNIHQCLM
jgi:hypothetical protein